MNAIKMLKQEIIWMKKLYYYWRYYSLGQDDYNKCMDWKFPDNVKKLLWVNRAVAIFTLIFSIHSLFAAKKLFNAGFYISALVTVLILFLFSKYLLYQQKKEIIIKKQIIFLLITIFYAIVIAYGIYISVWANPGKYAVPFMGILTCSLFLFTISPVFYLFHSFSAMIIFLTIIITNKSTENWTFDMANALFVWLLCLYYGWHKIMSRLNHALIVDKLENERNIYYDTSTIDELTQLKNRRDFMETFQRFLVNYRQSDNLLCLAVMDIDYFKNYNDFYGHPKGDECIRSVGKVLGSLNKSMNIYASRIGGEEFALLWFEKDITNVEKIASYLNQMIRDLNIQHENSAAAPYVTVSVGIHISRCGSGNYTQVIYDLADKALYAAKSGGRNRYVITSS